MCAVAGVALAAAFAPAVALADTATTDPAAAPTEPAAPSEPAPTIPAAQTPLVEWSDAVPPAIGITGVRSDLESARKHGLRLTYQVTEPVTLRADVLIYGDVVDRELRMCALPAAGPGDSLAKTTVGRTPTGTNALRVPFNVPSRRTLKKFLRITVQLRLIATDQAGNETTTTKVVALKRR